MLIFKQHGIRLLADDDFALTEPVSTRPNYEIT